MTAYVQPLKLAAGGIGYLVHVDGRELGPGPWSRAELDALADDLGAPRRGATLEALALSDEQADALADAIAAALEAAP